MTNSKDLFKDIVSRIDLPENLSEIQAIAYLLLENRLGLSKTEILSGKEIPDPEIYLFEDDIKMINDHMPIQYIINEAEFYGRKFKVNPSVLIPRPETELLVSEIKTALTSISQPHILDIGTGSGCLAITLYLELSNAVVKATDVSPEALETAMLNTKCLQAKVQFQEHDILQNDLTEKFDLIVSNPPYITQEEKKQMRKNVLDYEPHLALFAPSEDPLVFYKAIAMKSKPALKPGGSVWVEINEQFGHDTLNIFKDAGYRITNIIKDLDNKERIVAAYL